MSELNEPNILKRQALIENFAINIKLGEYSTSNLTLKNEFEEYLKDLKKSYPEPENKNKIMLELDRIIKETYPDFEVSCKATPETKADQANGD